MTLINLGYLSISLSDLKGTAIWKYIKKDNPYRNWDQFEGEEGIQPGMAPHGPSHVVYINSLMKKSPPNQKATDGSLIVKESYKRDMSLNNITVMLKKEGYFPEGGNWWWGTFAPNGEVLREGRDNYCFECHQNQTKTDYLFLRPSL